MKTKKEFRFFTIFQHEKEQEYLGIMHRAGWKFIKVTGFGMYHFEECEPEDVVYQLDYNQEGIAHKDEYVQMFKDCGWEYIQDYVGYSYFRKSASEMNGDEEIFCDDADRAAMMERVFKGRLTPLLVIFSGCLLPQFIINIGKNNGLAFVFGSILALYVAIFIGFGVSYARYKNNGRK